jgi:hypothetical protein
VSGVKKESEKAVTKKNYVERLEKTLERKIPEQERRWQIKAGSAVYGSNDEPRSQGWPID